MLPPNKRGALAAYRMAVVVATRAGGTGRRPGPSPRSAATAQGNRCGPKCGGGDGRTVRAGAVSWRKRRRGEPLAGRRARRGAPILRAGKKWHNGKLPTIPQGATEGGGQPASVRAAYGGGPHWCRGRGGRSQPGRMPGRGRWRWSTSTRAARGGLPGRRGRVRDAWRANRGAGRAKAAARGVVVALGGGRWCGLYREPPHGGEAAEGRRGGTRPSRGGFPAIKAGRPAGVDWCRKNSFGIHPAILPAIHSG